MFKELWANLWVRLAALAGVVVLLLLFILALRSVLVPLLFAFIVAYIFDPVADAFERRKLSRNLAVLWIVTLLLLAAIALPLVLVPSMVVEANNMIEEARQERAEKSAQPGSEDALNFAQRWLERGLQHLPLEQIAEGLGLTTETDESQGPSPEAGPDSGDDQSPTQPSPATSEAAAATNAPPPNAAETTTAPTAARLTPQEFREIIEERVGVWIRNNAANYLRAHKELLANAGKWAGASLADIMRTLGNTVVGVLLFLGQFVLFAVVTVYLLKDYDHIVASAHALVPPRYRVKTAEIAAKIDLQLKSFLRGQFLVCCCLGTMYCIGFFISGVPFALTLGLFGGAASFVPFLGLALTILPSVLLTLVDHGLDWHIVGVAATFGIAQFLEGNVLTPRIVGSQVGLGPVWVILAVMVFGTLFGFPGLLMAVPSAAILKVLVTEALEYYRKSPVFETAPPGGSGL